MKRAVRANLVVSIFLFVITSSSSSFGAILGDFNQDGVVDLREAMYALQVSAGGYPNLDPSCLLAGKGGWVSGIEYNACDVVEHGSAFYAAQQSHTAAGSNEPPNATYWTPLFFMGPPPIFITGTVPDEGIIFTRNFEEDTRARLSHAGAAVWGEYGGGFDPGAEPGGALGTESAGVEGFFGNTGPSGTIGTQWSGVDGKYSDTGPNASLGTETAGVYASFDDADGPNVSLAVEGGAIWGTFSSSNGGPYGSIGSEFDGVSGSWNDSGPGGSLGTDYAGVTAHYSYTEDRPSANLANVNNAFYGSYSSTGPSASIGTETMALYAVFSQDQFGTATGPNVELGSSTHAINASGEAHINGNMDVTGNVGIGTSTPSSKLAVAGLPTSPPDNSGNAGVVCVTNDGNFWLDVDGADCFNE